MSRGTVRRSPLGQEIRQFEGAHHLGGWWSSRVTEVPGWLAQAPGTGREADRSEVVVMNVWPESSQRALVAARYLSF